MHRSATIVTKHLFIATCLQPLARFITELLDIVPSTNECCQVATRSLIISATQTPPPSPIHILGNLPAQHSFVPSFHVNPTPRRRNSHHLRTYPQPLVTQLRDPALGTGSRNKLGIHPTHANHNPQRASLSPSPFPRSSASNIHRALLHPASSFAPVCSRQHSQRGCSATTERSIRISSRQSDDARCSLISTDI